MIDEAGVCSDRHLDEFQKASCIRASIERYARDAIVGISRMNFAIEIRPHCVISNGLRSVKISKANGSSGVVCSAFYGSAPYRRRLMARVASASSCSALVRVVALNSMLSSDVCFGPWPAARPEKVIQ